MSTLVPASDPRACKVEAACRGRAVVEVYAGASTLRSCQYHAREAVKTMLRKWGKAGTRRIGQLGGVRI